jgi:hypothetical protein
MKHVHVVYCCIWFVTASVFGTMTITSHQASGTSLDRFSTPPPGYGSKVDGINVGMEFRKLSETNNANVDKLEKSIRDSANLTFWLNLVSCVMAIVGFITEVAVYRSKLVPPLQGNATVSG